MRQFNAPYVLRTAFPGWALLAGLVVTVPSLWGQRDRLSGYLHDSERITLLGSVHPLARPEFDVDPWIPISNSRPSSSD